MSRYNGNLSINEINQFIEVNKYKLDSLFSSTDLSHDQQVNIIQSLYQNKEDELATNLFLISSLSKKIFRSISVNLDDNQFKRLVKQGKARGKVDLVDATYLYAIRENVDTEFLTWLCDEIGDMESQLNKSVIDMAIESGNDRAAQLLMMCGAHEFTAISADKTQNFLHDHDFFAKFYFDDRYNSMPLILHDLLELSDRRISSLMQSINGKKWLNNLILRAFKNPNQHILDVIFMSTDHIPNSTLIEVFDQLNSEEKTDLVSILLESKNIRAIAQLWEADQAIRQLAVSVLSQITKKDIEHLTPSNKELGDFLTLFIRSENYFLAQETLKLSRFISLSMLKKALRALPDGELGEEVSKPFIRHIFPFLKNLVGKIDDKRKAASEIVSFLIKRAKNEFVVDDVMRWLDSAKLEYLYVIRWPFKFIKSSTWDNLIKMSKSKKKELNSRLLSHAVMLVKENVALKDNVLEKKFTEPKLKYKADPDVTHSDILNKRKYVLKAEVLEEKMIAPDSRYKPKNNAILTADIVKTRNRFFDPKRQAIVAPMPVLKKQHKIKKT